MDDPRILRVITVGLVLAALAVGYFLLTGGLGVKPKKVQTQTTQTNKVTQTPTPASPSSLLGQNTQPTPTPTSSSAYERIVNRTQGGVQTLPRTGFPIGLVLVFSASAIISGWSLRKFPS